MLSIRWISKKQEELDKREEELDRRQKILDMTLLDLAIIARKNRLNNLNGIYFDAIK